MQYLWFILSFLFTSLVFYLFYKMTHSNKKNPNNPNNNEKWGAWKSIKIYVALLTVFSILFYSILHISFIQQWFFPGTAILSMSAPMTMMGQPTEEYEEQAQNQAKVIQYQTQSGGQMQDNTRIRSNSNSNTSNIFQSIKKTMTGGGSSNSRNNNVQQETINEYNDNIFTDPPNF